MKQRILTLQLKRIGDLLLTAPALQQLRQARPEAEISIVVPRPMRDLARCFTGVDQVLSYGGGGLNLSVWTHLFWGDWSACLDFTGTDRSTLMTRLSRAKDRVGYAKFNDSSVKRVVYTALSDASVRELHTLDFHQALVDRWLGREPGEAGEEDCLRVPEFVAERVAGQKAEFGLEQDYAVVHPGTARQEKFWPVERWIEVMEDLNRRGLRVVLTGTGKGLEAETVRRLRSELGDRMLDLTGRLSLPEMLGWLQEARVALGVDSMAMHMAALWRRPQVVLFGPTNPYHWRPRHPLARVLTPSGSDGNEDFDPYRKGGEMNEISTASVIGATESVLAVSS